MAADLTPAQLAGIRERSEKAREFACHVGKVTYTLRRPSGLRFREMVLATSGDRAQLERHTVIGCVVGWVGPKVSDVDPSPEAPEIGELPLPCTPGMVELYLEDRMDDFGQISEALMASINKTEAERVTAKKASAG